MYIYKYIYIYIYIYIYMYICIKYMLGELLASYPVVFWSLLVLGMPLLVQPY